MDENKNIAQPQMIERRQKQQQKQSTKSIFWTQKYIYKAENFFLSQIKQFVFNIQSACVCVCASHCKHQFAIHGSVRQTHMLLMMMRAVL